MTYHFDDDQHRPIPFPFGPPIWPAGPDYHIPIVSPVGRGPKGDTFTYDDLSQEQIAKIGRMAILEGAKGDKGEPGYNFAWVPCDSTFAQAGRTPIPSEGITIGAGNLEYVGGTVLYRQVYTNGADGWSASNVSTTYTGAKKIIPLAAEVDFGLRSKVRVLLDSTFQVSQYGVLCRISNQSGGSITVKSGDIRLIVAYTTE